MDEGLLKKVDIIRERLDVSYTQARQALQEADGDVVAALANLEETAEAVKQPKPLDWDKQKDEFIASGSELVETVKELIRRGNISKLKVLHKEEVLFEMPFTVGVAAVLVLPQLILLAGIAAIFSEVTIKIERPEAACPIVEETTDDSENLE